MGTKIAGGIVALLAVAWFALFFSNRAILISARAPEGGVGMLECRYFTGTGISERKFLYTRGLGLGRDTCPRLVMAST